MVRCLVDLFGTSCILRVGVVMYLWVFGGSWVYLIV